MGLCDRVDDSKAECLTQGYAKRHVRIASRILGDTEISKGNPDKYFDTPVDKFDPGVVVLSFEWRPNKWHVS
jgi:hypothetical protein